MKLFVDFLRLMLYPVIMLGFFLIAAKDRRIVLFTALMVHFAAVSLGLALRLAGHDGLVLAVVVWMVTPSVVLLACALWWTIWHERKVT